ncbi:MAG TPA: hypothetical protein VEK08_16515 [Planctomycetota bacterium]|nr:hypothetical protein [Planctomycetota bacterium]
MNLSRLFQAILVSMIGFLSTGAIFADAAADAKKAEEKKKADEAKKKAADEAKKKAAEEAKKKAEAEKIKQDDPANWRPRDFNKLLTQPMCVFIKDAGAKKNPEAEFILGPEMLGNTATRQKLRGFIRVKIKNDGTDAKNWPAEWLKRAENGAALVLISADMSQIVFVDGGQAKSMLNSAAFNQVVDEMVKKELARKAKVAEAAAAAKAKAAEEAAKAPKPVMPVDKPEVPGLDKLGATTEKDKKKADPAKKKEPQEE